MGVLSICKALHVESGMRSPDEGDVLMEAKQSGARNAFGLGLSRSGDKSFARAVHVQVVSKNRTNTPQQKAKLLFSLACNCNYSIEVFSTGTPYMKTQT
jgi:hypothetical protein